ncbi:hypothetical protein EKD16_24090 [Streptomonospora litoralis]|uniref:Uncharacterized protein n=1 Tax=Streptomonospora litoralis TaxID=2498135 RepID=A0A4P6Q789_9ACTN|nr:hypothetical protein EKD16_24090 [Streptomonospora litoralis]
MSEQVAQTVGSVPLGSASGLLCGLGTGRVSGCLN